MANLTAAEERQLKRIGKNMEAAMKRKDVGFREMARRTGLHLRSIQKIRSGEISLLSVTLIKIKLALGISWAELMKGVK